MTYQHLVDAVVGDEAPSAWTRRRGGGAGRGRMSRKSPASPTGLAQSPVDARALIGVAVDREFCAMSAIACPVRILWRTAHGRARFKRTGTSTGS